MASTGSAKRYAQAVFQIAIGNNDVDIWRSELDTVAATLSDPQLKGILEDPKVRLDDKTDLVSKCLPGLSQLALNLSYILVSKQAIGILDGIVLEYNRMADAHEGLEHARVVTAVELDDADSAYRFREECRAQLLALHIALGDISPEEVSTIEQD